VNVSVFLYGCVMTKREDRNKQIARWTVEENTDGYYVAFDGKKKSPCYVSKNHTNAVKRSMAIDWLREIEEDNK